MENRIFTYEVLAEIQKQWSPRAFDEERPVAREDLMALLEAARYAPSCFNEQPWRYLVTFKGEEEHEKLCQVLVPANAEWASKAPVLLMILAKQRFEQNGKENRWHAFDAGTSWGYLNLEAYHRGLVTHAMGGFSVEKARETFGISEEYTVIATVAVGYYGNKDALNPKNKASEHPSPRKNIEEILFVK